MALTTEQLARLVTEVGQGLQQIQDELGTDVPGGKIRFPRGYIRSVGQRIPSFWWIDDQALSRNICYHLSFRDVLRWLLERTDIYAAAASMIVKHNIAVMGGIAESLTVAAMARLGHGKRKFETRLVQLCKDGVITGSIADELRWLWEARSAIHLYDVESLEHDAYTREHGQRAENAYRALRDSLDAAFKAIELIG